MLKTLKSCEYWLLTTLQWTNITSIIFSCGTLSSFLSLVILFSVLQSSLFHGFGCPKLKRWSSFDFKCNSFLILLKNIWIGDLSVNISYFMKIYSKYCTYLYHDLIKILYTCFKSCFARHNEYTICRISFAKFSDALPAFTCVNVIDNPCCVCLVIILWFFFFELIFLFVYLTIKFQLKILISILFHKILVKMIDLIHLILLLFESIQNISFLKIL